MITVNGEAVSQAEGKTLKQFLADANYAVPYVAVEYNGEIVPREEYGRCLLSGGDVLEVINFVAGG